DIDPSSQPRVPQPDTTYRLRQLDGARTPVAVLTSETGIFPTATANASYTVTIAGGDPNLYADGVRPYSVDAATGTLQQPTARSSLVVGRVLYVDVGERQQVAVIQAKSPPDAVPYQVTLQFINESNGSPVAAQAHAAGFLLSNVPLGNPGPQGTIDLFTSSRFKNVVPYTLIIE